MSSASPSHKSSSITIDRRDDGNNPSQKRMKSAKLSCLECRRKKLACDRKLPCQRCIRARRPERCSYEDGPQKVVLSVAEKNGEKEHAFDEHLGHLRNEVAELRSELLRVQSMLINNVNLQNTFQNATSDAFQSVYTEANGNERIHSQNTNDFCSNKIEGPYSNYMRDSLESKEGSRTYYTQNFLFQFFREIPSLYPLMRETEEEWIRPLGVNLRKDKSAASNRKEVSQPNESVDNLLPSRQDADALVSFYLNHLEHIHRIVHVPTFRREFENFWDLDRPRYPAMTALILAISSLSAAMYSDQHDPTVYALRYRKMHKRWLSECDAWLSQAGRRHRKLVHHQVACLIYLAKRVNMIEKRGWWKDTGSMVQMAVMDGLHCNAPSDTPYSREMKRRVWLTIRELDLRNSFEFGLPSLLFNINGNYEPPQNLDDKDFDKKSEAILADVPGKIHSITSYQHYSSQSWSLRLEIAQRLSTKKASSSFKLAYQDALQYSHLITQALNELPVHASERDKNEKADFNLLIISSLRLQLQQCLIAVHRPFLARANKANSLSESICYTTSHDILLSNKNLENGGWGGMTALRDDVLLGSLTTTRIILQQSSGSTKMITEGAQRSIELLEDCLPMMAEKIVRRSAGRHWGFLTLCGAISLLKMKQGAMSHQEAKSYMARQVLDTHYKYFGKQGSVEQSGQGLEQAQQNNDRIDQHERMELSEAAPFATESAWLDDAFPEFDMASLDLNMNINGIWDNWQTL